MVSCINTAKKKTFDGIYLGVQLLSLGSFVVMLFEINRVESAILFFPSVFFVINLLFFKNYVQKELHLTKLLVLLLYFVRLSILPLLYFISGETRLYQGKFFMTSDSIQKAFFLMVYEYFVVQFVIFLHKKIGFSFNTKVRFSGMDADSRLSIIRTYNFFPTLLLCMTVYAIAVYIFLPEVQGSFKTLLMLNQVDFSMSGYLASSNQVGSLRRIIATLFSVVFTMLRILLPAYFLVRAKEKQKSGICILFVSVIFQFAFITSTFAQSIVAALTIVLLFDHLYPKKKKFVSLMIAMTTAGIIMLYFFVKYAIGSGMYSGGTGLIAYIAKIVSAYFTGIENVAGCFNVPEEYRLETAVSDFVGAIPFNSTLFGSWKGRKFQSYFNTFNYSYGQIPPAIGSGYYHFGWLFSPIYVVIMLKLSMYHCEKAQMDTNSWRYAVNTFCCIVLALGLVMYNEAIAFSWYFGWGVMMFLALKFTNKDEFA